MGDETLAEARRRFFADIGFAPDGGYDDAWADAKFGPLPYTVPNPRMRAEALRFHDLRRELRGAAVRTPTSADALTFLGWSALATALAVIFALGSPLLVLAALVRRWTHAGLLARRRRVQRPQRRGPRVAVLESVWLLPALGLTRSVPESSRSHRSGTSCSCPGNSIVPPRAPVLLPEELDVADDH